MADGLARLMDIGPQCPAFCEHSKGKLMNKLRIVVSFLLAALLMIPVGASAQRTYINPSLASGSAAPFSGAVQTGETLYLSGMLGLENGQVPADPAQEARNVLNAIQSTLEQAGMTMDDLVYVQIFCSDVAHYDVFNGVYRGYFTQEFPARAFVGVGTLLFDARFEIQAIAVKR